MKKTYNDLKAENEELRQALYHAHEMFTKTCLYLIEIYTKMLAEKN